MYCCDVGFTLTKSRWVSRLSTGIRALDHSVGGSSIIICRERLTPLSSENLYRPLVPHPVKILCYAAMADLFKYLRESKVDPQSVEIRQKLQVAAWMSLWPMKMEKYRYSNIFENSFLPFITSPNAVLWDYLIL